ncbi:BlaI/MecI/CopY family transcriptional regulator [Flavilitoribacter nigricans]|uniref:CopY family transcriptional regulator n=1 Tax=Flavilitoribacter nigricans (strain ATCC 23147 / DSM 23189 / NBRC 102662 / NCIMB 1420 / SS-2) TaxID=1122177 RepID=A0A2D0N5J9_FLAN2|nr:BlaI/MecI/CopY family transcriptional regulator [Flavilitoribacter nigricans]PHN03668.1 CopY family transcriptional regulator [Flavilitoribacter nigricans DSM 23189 = NBRC 102662]
MEIPDPHQLSRRERQIMDLFFQHGELSAQAVQEQLPDAPGYATVRSLLRILEEKGHLSHSKSGRQFIYRPVAGVEKVKHQRLNHLLRTFFGGSISEAVAAFIQDPDNDLRPEELEELDKIIREARDK